MEEIQLDGARIWLPSLCPDNQVEDGNLDVHVHVAGGEHRGSYVTTFYTIENVRYLLEKFKREGECANGLYMYDVSFIIIREITTDSLTKAVEDLIATGEIVHAMQAADPID